jgi:uncharacterized membrane protein YphA (DoxX/SURF4 family)
MDKSEYGTFALRIGLGLFFLIFGILKFVSSGPMTQMVYPSFWGGLSVNVLIYIIGVLQIILAVMLFVGWKTRIATAVLGLMHLGTVVVTFPRIITPFSFPEGGPPNFLFFSAVPILAALIALFLQGDGPVSVSGKQ